MDFLDRLYSSNYFGIGLFAVIAFLVVTFLIVLFFGKKDEKKRKLEATKTVDVQNTVNTMKETSTPTPVEIPVNPEPVAPINLEATPTPSAAPVEPSVVTPVEPVKPVVTPVIEDNNYVDNLKVEEPARNVNTNNVAPVEPVIPQVAPVIPEQPETSEPTVRLEPTRIEVPQTPITPIVEPATRMTPEPVQPIINEPVIKEEEPKLQINEEPVINTYYKPTEKTEAEPIKVPNIDFDSLARSISKELDELEGTTKKYDEVKVTPLKEVTAAASAPSPAYNTAYVSQPSATKEPMELPKKIDLPAKKAE